MPNRPLNKLPPHSGEQCQCPSIKLSVRFSRYAMAVASVTQITQFAIKQFETPRRRPRGSVLCRPLSAYILQCIWNCELNLASIKGSLLNARPANRQMRVIPGHKEKAASYALSASSKTPGINPKAEGLRSSPICGDAREAFLISCRDLSVIWPGHESLLFWPVRHLHSYTWLASIANHMQHLLFPAVPLFLFVSMCSSK